MSTSSNNYIDNKYIYNNYIHLTYALACKAFNKSLLHMNACLKRGGASKPFSFDGCQRRGANAVIYELALHSPKFSSYRFKEDVSYFLSRSSGSRVGGSFSEEANVKQ
jgi:hypothetical protein